jgi:hypothetical protein
MAEALDSVGMMPMVISLSSSAAGGRPEQGQCDQDSQNTTCSVHLLSPSCGFVMNGCNSTPPSNLGRFPAAIESVLWERHLAAILSRLEATPAHR